MPHGGGDDALPPCRDVGGDTRLHKDPGPPPQARGAGRGEMGTGELGGGVPMAGGDPGVQHPRVPAHTRVQPARVTRGPPISPPTSCPCRVCVSPPRHVPTSCSGAASARCATATGWGRRWHWAWGDDDNGGGDGRRPHAPTHTRTHTATPRHATARPDTPRGTATTRHDTPRRALTRRDGRRHRGTAPASPGDTRGTGGPEGPGCPPPAPRLRRSNLGGVCVKNAPPGG